MNSTLDFNKISWEEFQQLTLFLAQQQFHEPSFEEYLKKGHDQQGIDIVGFSRQIGKYLTIQCKHKVKIGISEFRGIIELFENGTYGNITGHFILAATADLQMRKFQDEIVKQRERLKKERGLEFDVWDFNYLNTQLRDHYRLVHHFFGLEDADRHCFSLPKKKSEITPLVNYIQRTLSEASEFGAEEQPNANDSKARYSTLPDLLEDKPFLTKAICVIADAYQGKSTLLRQTGYELSIGELPYDIIFLELKSTVLRPIADILTSRFATWRQSPGKNIILMIDGLDEVPTDRFLDTVDHIAEFIFSFDSVNVVFSCRKLFYNQYGLKRKMPRVAFYELDAMNYRQKHDFIERKLGATQVRPFLNTINGLRIGELLDHPFYLINLLDWYIESPEDLPKNKIGVVKRFVEQSLKTSADRKLPKGLALSERRVDFRKALQRLALAFQIQGVNAADDDFMQTILDPGHLELIRHSSIITRGAENWSFANAVFQEQLAALELDSMHSDKILNLVTTGKHLRKIKTKWIQTMASAISLMEEGSETRKALISFIRNDNIELLTLSDGSKFTDQYRLGILKEIMAIRIDRRNWLLVVSDTDVAAFVGNIEDAVRYLADLLSKQIDATVKILIMRILRNMSLVSIQIEHVRQTVLNEIPLIKDADYGRNLVDFLTRNEQSDHSFLIPLFSKPLIRSHELRNSLYRYLIKNKLVDSYYEFGLEGIAFLVSYNNRTSHYGSERDLEEFLLYTQQSSNLKKLYLFMQQNDWLTFYRYKADSLKPFLEKLVRKSIDAYFKDKTILPSIVLFIVTLQRLAIKDDFEMISRFFWETGTNYQALMIFLSVKNDYHWEFSDILDEKCTAYLLYAHEEAEIDKRTLESFYNGLIYKDRKPEAEIFRSQIDAAFGVTKYQDGPDVIYRAHEKQKFKNDLTCIRSLDDFISGVEKYFQAFGSEKLSYEQLYINPTKKSVRQNADSNFVNTFLSQMCSKEGTVSLSACLEALNGNFAFKDRRAYLINTYNFRQQPEEQQLLDILHEYFDATMKEADFINAYRDEPGRIVYKRREVLLVDIWTKFGFQVDDHVLLGLLWMDTSGVNGIEHHQLNKTFSICSKILESFVDRPEQLVAKIEENLAIGIACESVLATHIGLCKYLKIISAMPTIFDAIISGQVKYSIDDAIDIYAELGGDISALDKFYTNLEALDSYHFLHLSKLLIQSRPELVLTTIWKAIWAVDVSIDQKNELATLLCRKGDRAGYAFLIGQLNDLAKNHQTIRLDPLIASIDTRSGMEDLQPYLHLAVSRKGKNHPFNKDAGGFVVGLINAFANKGEKDLLIVSEILSSTIEKNKDENPDFIHLLDYLDIAMEDFRAKEGSKIDAESIRKELRPAN